MNDSTDWTDERPTKYGLDRWKGKTVQIGQMEGKDGTDWTEERVRKYGLDRWEGNTAQIGQKRG